MVLRHGFFPVCWPLESRVTSPALVDSCHVAHFGALLSFCLSSLGFVGLEERAGWNGPGAALEFA